MQISYPLTLQILSLEFSNNLEEDLSCAISLTKGTNNFGDIQFKVDKNYHLVTFDQLKIIVFWFLPHEAVRNNELLKIVLSRLETGQLLGNIPISSSMLADTFEKNKSAVIEESTQFLEGVTLKFKIYIDATQLKYHGFLKEEQNDFNSNSISSPDNPTKKSPLKENSDQKGQIFYLHQQQHINKMKVKRETNNVGKIYNFVVDNYPKIDNSRQTIQKMDSKKEITTDQNNFCSAGQKKQQKRLTLTKQIHDHHQINKLSLKLKTVIFLLVFGFFIMYTKMYQNKEQNTNFAKKYQQMKKKKQYLPNH